MLKTLLLLFFSLTSIITYAFDDTEKMTKRIVGKDSKVDEVSLDETQNATQW